MPEQAPAPGSAPQGAGSAEGTPTPAAGTTVEDGAKPAGEGAPAAGRDDALANRILEAVKQENKKNWDAMASRSDKRMDRIERALTAPRARPSSGEEYDDDGTGAGTAGGETRRAPVASLDPETEEQIATNSFQNRHEDFRDYWEDDQAIARNKEDAAPFRMLKDDGNDDIKIDV